MVHAKVRGKGYLRKMLRWTISKGQHTQGFLSCTSLAWECFGTWEEIRSPGSEFSMCMRMGIDSSTNSC